jgi:uncharacterized membrane protein YhaH (DUF805 family)
MSTPDGHQEPYGPNPDQPQPSQPAGGQDTRGLEDDIPRQQAPRADQSSGAGQDQRMPGQDGGWAASQQGTYSSYPPPAGGYYAGATRPRSYLDGAPVGFVDAVREAFGNLFTYRGRASRSAFWWFALLQVIAYAVVSWISNDSRVAGIILDVLIGIPFILAGIALAVRRLHDSGRTGWWWWIGFIPVIGGIILLVFYLLSPTPGPNKYNITR